MSYYINFYFRELTLDGNIINGVFDAPGSKVFCRFKYNIESREYFVWDNNKPVDEILPLPLWFLNMKLEENGNLKSTESKISI